MNRYWSQIVAGLHPYVPGEQPRLDGLIKLNTNENPYGPSPRVLEAIRQATTEALRLYPDPSSTAIKTAVARHHGLDEAQVFVGNGSDEVLAHAFLGLLRHEQPLLFPDVTYSFYRVYAELYGVKHETIPLAADLTVRVEDYLGCPAGAVILANPNAPTGIRIEPAAIERLVTECATIPVVIDEAYIDFGGITAAGLIHRHPNLLVVQTLSKSRSLAGLRVGFAMGDAGLIEALTRVKDSFNSYPVDRLATVGAAAALDDREHFDACRHRVIATRTWLGAELGALGFQVLPSAANFLFVRHPERDAATLAAALRERAILVRHFETPPRIKQFLRISVGTEDQCETLVAELRQLLSR
ncbi:MAG: histidinol-phosphate transaminase [Polyangiaceae bacterium]|nr:histidinol-phosphate transaminase [Polyangiaceae bacterium]